MITKNIHYTERIFGIVTTKMNEMSHYAEYALHRIRYIEYKKYQYFNGRKCRGYLMSRKSQFESRDFGTKSREY